MRFRLLPVLFFIFFSRVSLYAEIRVIPDRQYFNIVHEELSQAKESIEVEMYLVYSNNPPVKELLDEIIEAKERGVEVSILLEDGQEENKLTAEYLKDRGVIAGFDEPETKLHAKLILVDRKKLIIGSSNWTKKAFSENNESNVMVDIEEDKDKIEILRIDYADKLLEAIDKAEKEIDIVMYSFEFRDEEGSKNYEIMSALLRAYDRGCRIKLMLDSWQSGESGNEPAYELLEQVGAQVYYDLDTVASHNKLVIVDKETVFLGSANWTESGLTKNREASILIRDIQTSLVYKAYVDELVKGLPGETKPRVSIPLSFLKEGGVFRQLYIKGAIESLRLYIWLIWEAFNRGTFTLQRDYKRWYGAIYAEPVLPWSVNKSRRISTLVQYLEKAGAIVREKVGEEITLVEVAEKAKDGRDTNCLFVLPEFWTLGWIKKLSGPGLYFYFINLAEFKKSPYKPVWLNSEPKLSWEYGMGRRSIRAGLKELMSYNLIEVEHDIPEPGQSFNKRKANRYFINSLWGEEEWQSDWTRLVEREGLDLVLKARGLAARINEPYDLRAVSSVIGFIHRYGEKAVTEVIDKVTRLSFQNGKWELRYIAGILQRDYSPQKTRFQLHVKE